MGVTRLKRKDRRNKVVAKNEVQFLKLGSNIEAGSRSKMPAGSQIVKNNAVLDKLAASKK
ncbi:spore protein [Parapedobacter lycopersici]|uniref:spore protein n=1 Tax=Parapedobacter lycopersici TaxID=1864939 RepID=UPI00214D986B|nr:spore protein [Parapedobacter lycopersici]